MRTITYGGAVSLDGFLAAADGSYDWIHFSADVQQITKDFWKDVDVMLMGRKTWEVAVAQSGATSRRSSKRSQARAPKMRTYVFSRTLPALDAPGVELVRGDAVAFVRELKQTPGGRICLMGGGELATSLIHLDELIDRSNRRVVSRLLELGPENLEWGLRAIVASRCLERVGDHAVDIGEQAAFLATGEFREFTDASHDPRPLG